MIHKYNDFALPHQYVLEIQKNLALNGPCIRGITQIKSKKKASNQVRKIYYQNTYRTAYIFMLWDISLLGKKNKNTLS